MILRVWDVTFAVSDLKRAVVFYEQVLELPKKYQFSNYAGFDCGGVEVGLVLGKPAKVKKGVPCVDFLVLDIDRVYLTLSGRGVHFVEEPHDTAWGGRIALLADPDGNQLQLVQIKWSDYFALCAPKESQ